MLGRVHLVEGLVRDVRARGDLGDRQPGEALLGDDRGGRVDDPFALAFDDLVARQVAGARSAAGPRRGGARSDGRSAALSPSRRRTRRRALQPERQASSGSTRPSGRARRELGQLLRATLAQARGGDLADAADQELRPSDRAAARRSAARDRRRRSASSACSVRLRRSQRARTGAEGAEQRERHRLRLGGAQLGEGVERDAQALLLGESPLAHTPRRPSASCARRCPRRRRAAALPCRRTGCRRSAARRARAA